MDKNDGIVTKLSEELRGMDTPPIVSPDEWEAARQELLPKEKELTHARDAIDDIDDALASMATGTYGLCESCQTPIPIERLEAIPRARRCVACSDRRATSTR